MTQTGEFGRYVKSTEESTIADEWIADEDTRRLGGTPKVWEGWKIMRGPSIRGNAVGIFTWKDDDTIEWQAGSTVFGRFADHWAPEDDDVGASLKRDNRAFILNLQACAALKKDGSVVVQGCPHYIKAVSAVDEGRLASGVKDMVATEEDFAFLKDDGSVVMLGKNTEGYEELLPALTGVKSIVANRYTFAALKTDGSVVIFGHPGGGATGVWLCGDAKAVYAHSSGCCFFALKTNGSVALNGRDEHFQTRDDYGNWTDDPALEKLTDVQEIFMNQGAMAAVKGDGSIVVLPSPGTKAAEGKIFVGYHMGEDGERVDIYSPTTDTDGKTFVEKVTEDAKAACQ